MSSAQPQIDLRVMPRGDGHWYWEVVTDGRVLRRGVSDTEHAADDEAKEAARAAGEPHEQTRSASARR
jgi:hypothetical protein